MPDPGACWKIDLEKGLFSNPCADCTAQREVLRLVTRAVNTRGSFDFFVCFIQLLGWVGEHNGDGYTALVGGLY